MHYRTLQFCLKMGLEIVEIHRILQFEQKAWLKPYVDFNTQKRAEAAMEDNTFLQMFHKLLVNILYGKCVQNLRKHINVHVVSNVKKLRKLICKPCFKGSNVIHEDLQLVETYIENLMMNRPVGSGFAVLELQNFICTSFTMSISNKDTLDRNPH